MAIVSLLDVSLSFGGAPLLDRVNLQIDRGERVCLVGRNGAGKSTLMKVIAGELKPDDGKVFRTPPDAVIATLRQEVPAGLAGTVQQVVEGEGGNTALVDEDDVNEEAQGLLHTLLHKRTGLDKFELNRVQACNDMFAGTPKARYTHVLQTVREIARQEV